MLTLLTALALATGDLPGNSVLDARPAWDLPGMSEEGEAPLPVALADDGDPRFAIGLTVAYLKVDGADDPTIFYGIHARIYLMSFLAVEGLVGTAKSDFEDGDGTATQVPIQVTALLMPFQGLPVRPYALAGLGWYFTDVEYSGGLAALDDEQDSTFGFHLGLGAELKVGILMLHLDIRYVFMQDPNLDADLNDFNYYTINIGAAIAF